MENALLSDTKNDMLSLLRGSDLLDLLEVVENQNVEYREGILIPKDVTFGVEIEFERVNRKLVKEFIEKNVKSWKACKDGSLSNGGEIVSPILIDERKTWEELKKICKYLKKENAYMNKHAGGHIHVGVPVLGNDVEGWRIFLKIIMLYENILYRFYYGDKLNGRPVIKKYAPPISEELFEYLDEINGSKTVEDIVYWTPSERYHSINFENVESIEPDEKSYKNTIELRCPNASDEEVIWQNNINTFSKLLISSGARVIDEDFLNYKLKNYVPDVYNPLIYNEIYLKKALELVDLIFSNNKDKVYFLRQYLKNFQSGVEASEAITAKRFIS